MEEGAREIMCSIDYVLLQGEGRNKGGHPLGAWCNSNPRPKYILGPPNLSTKIGDGFSIEIMPERKSN